MSQVHSERSLTEISEDSALTQDEIATTPTLAPRILAYSLLLGIAGDLLLRDVPAGVAFPLWTALVVLVTTSLIWRTRREVSVEAAGWLLTALLFSAGLAWRDSGTLHALNVLATLGALGMAAIAVSDARAGLFAAQLRDTVWAAAALARSVLIGFAPLAIGQLFGPEVRGRWAGRVRPTLRAMLIAGAVIVVFGSLLRDADPIFASFVALPGLDLALVGSHLFVVGIFTWVVSGWTRGALVVHLGKTRAPSSLPVGFSLLDVTAALGTLVLLFATYVVAQLGWFFGGEQFLQARTGLTAAEYARRGFFEMVWVAALVIPLLVGTRAALKPGRALERRHTALALPLIVLLGVMIVSAMTRMRLYVHLFGLTTDRVYPIVFMGWLMLVLVWLAFTVLRGRGATFVAGAVISGALTLLALNVVAPDAMVAQFNVERAAHRTGDKQAALDLRYLARLSGDAAGVATRATLASPGSAPNAESDQQRCSASKTLLRRWGPASKTAARQRLAASWRFWNAAEASAVRVVGEHSAALLRVQHATCVRVPRELR